MSLRLASLCITFTLIASACSTTRSTRVVRVPATVVRGGAYTAVDALASRAIGDCLSRPWYRAFRSRTGRSPRVRVASIALRGEAVVSSPALTSSLQRALAAAGALLSSGSVASSADADTRGDVGAELRDQAHHAAVPRISRVQAPPTQRADYVLVGAVHTERSGEGLRAQLALSLIEADTNVKVWMHTQQL